MLEVSIKEGTINSAEHDVHAGMESVALIINKYMNFKHKSSGTIGSFCVEMKELKALCQCVGVDLDLGEQQVQDFFKEFSYQMLFHYKLKLTDLLYRISEKEAHDLGDAFQADMARNRSKLIIVQHGCKAFDTAFIMNSYFLKVSQLLQPMYRNNMDEVDAITNFPRLRHQIPLRRTRH